LNRYFGEEASMSTPRVNLLVRRKNWLLAIFLLGLMA
jgi:hypothetical protein